MRVQLTFKSPDVVDYALNDLFSDEENDHDDIDGLDRDTLENDLKRYIQYGEYLTVEYDSETKKMSVIPVSNDGRSRLTKRNFGV